MKTLIGIVSAVLLGCLSFASYAQSFPEKDDYVYLTWPNSTAGHYIFKQSKLVFYNWDRAQATVENCYHSGDSLRNALFVLADSIAWEKLKGLDESTLKITEENQYSIEILEYRINQKSYRICWDTRNPQFARLTRMRWMLSSFW